MSILAATTSARRPWGDLPPSLGALLRPELPALADEIVAAIAAEVSDYARPLVGPFGRGVRVGVEEALSRFVGLVEDPDGGEESGREVYVALGRGEWRAGRSLDALQAAYRIGARVAWRRMAGAGLAAEVDSAQLALLAEAIFAYIDELSSLSVEGYARAQTRAAGERERRRRRLLELLLAGPGDPEALSALAEAAGWSLPQALAAVVAPEATAPRLPGSLGSEALVGAVDGLTCAIVPDPDGPGRAAQLEAALADLGAVAIGPTVAPAAAAESFARARRALSLVEAGRLEGAENPVRADDHLLVLLLAADAPLLADLGRRRLAALDREAATARARLEETLLAWLSHQGHVPSTAGALHVHPQTVRYRLTRLRELLGPDLDDPTRRFELELALRARVGAHLGPSR